MEPEMGIAAPPAAALIGFVACAPHPATGHRQCETLAGALGSSGVHWTPELTGSIPCASA